MWNLSTKPEEVSKVKGAAAGAVVVSYTILLLVVFAVVSEASVCLLLLIAFWNFSNLSLPRRACLGCASEKSMFGRILVYVMIPMVMSRAAAWTPWTALVLETGGHLMELPC